jgi:NADH-quinone oxidoreductase subunit N
MITGPDLQSLLPIEILAGGMLFTMLGIAVKRSHTLAFVSTLLTIAGALAAVLFGWPQAPHNIDDLYRIDRFGSYFQTLILFATIVISIFSYISLRNFFPERRKEEYYLLLLLATLGTCTMVISIHFISFFVALEVLNISLYALISYYRDRPAAIEAGIKYLILAAMSSAFLLFGMALIYTATGALSFHQVAAAASHLSPAPLTMLIGGVGLMLTGIGFKMALAPFHMWAPDVYQGASSPIGAFIATVSKGAMVAVLLRFFYLASLDTYPKIMLVMTIIAVLSMLTGNLLALRQNNVSRMLAYSSIAHFGYLLVALVAGQAMGTEAVLFYLTAYILTILGAFGLITLLSTSDAEATDIRDYAGLFWRKPFSATIFSIVLLSLAGIPLTAGFMGKFLLLTAGVAKGNWLLVMTLVISSVIGLYYYLRFIFSMMRTDGTPIPITVPVSRGRLTGMIVLASLGAAILWVGIFPAWLLMIIKSLTGIYSNI